MGEMVNLEQSTAHSGTHWASLYKILSCLVDALCQPVHIYLLHSNCILLTDCVMVILNFMQLQYKCEICQNNMYVWF